MNYQGLNKIRMNDQGLNKTRMNDQGLNKIRMNDQGLNKTRINDQRLNKMRMNDPGLALESYELMNYPRTMTDCSNDHDWLTNQFSDRSVLCLCREDGGIKTILNQFLQLQLMLSKLSTVVSKVFQTDIGSF